MKNLILVTSSAAAGLVLTLITAVVTLLSLMFSTGQEYVRKVGLFGSLFFETTAAPGGATGVSMGVANLGVLVGVFAAFLAAVLLVQLMYRHWRSDHHVVAQGAGA